MNSTTSTLKISRSRLAKQGGRYILQTHLFSQLISSLVGPILGFYFVYITIPLTRSAFLRFTIAVAITLVLVNFIHYFYAATISQRSRIFLDHIYKGVPLPAGTDEQAAWDEIVLFPRRSVIAQVVLIAGLIVAPLMLYMYYYGGVVASDLVYMGIAGALNAQFVLILSFFYLESRLAPARNALLPKDQEKQKIHLSVSQAVRQFIVIAVIFMMVAEAIGGLATQVMTRMTSEGYDPVKLFANFQRNEIVVLALLLLIGIYVAYQSSRVFARPTRELIHTMEGIREKKFSERAQITTSDDMADLTIRFNQMLAQLETTQSTLEKQVQERTTSLEQRSRQLQAAAQVAREAASLVDINTMLDRTVRLVSEQFGFYHAGIFLMDDSAEFVYLRAASSEGGKRMLDRNHRLLVGQQGIVGAAAFLNRPRIALDVGADQEFLTNPDLPLTRSEVAIPLTVQQKVIGVLDIQSTEASKFSTGDIDVLQILADQVALAIQNARLFSESQEAIQRLQTLSTEGSRRIWQEMSRNMKNAYRYTSSGLIPVSRQEDAAATAGSDYLRIPIQLRGQKIGTIALHRPGETSWSEADQALASEVSTQIGLALENARLVQDAQVRAEREQALSQMTARIRESLDLDVVMQTAVREIKQTFDLDQAEVRLQLENRPGDNPIEA